VLCALLPLPSLRRSLPSLHRSFPRSPSSQPALLYTQPRLHTPQDQRLHLPSPPTQDPLHLALHPRRLSRRHRLTLQPPRWATARRQLPSRRLRRNLRFRLRLRLRLG